MGFFDKFGAGGGKLRVELDQRSAAAGGTISGKVVFTGGKRAQKGTSLSVALAQQDGGQYSVANLTKKEIHGPFVSEAGQVQEFPFELGIPTVVMNSAATIVNGKVAQTVLYAVWATADIPGEIDPNTHSEAFEVTGGVDVKITTG